MKKLWLIAIAFALSGWGSQVFAQQQGDGVIQIEAQRIDTRVELPQVQILDKRKKSDFDEVKVEKSFRSELSGKNEELQFTPNTSGRIKPIANVEALLKKKRF